MPSSAIRLSMVTRNVTPSLCAMSCASFIMVAASSRVSANWQMSTSVAWVNAELGDTLVNGDAERDPEFVRDVLRLLHHGRGKFARLGELADVHERRVGQCRARRYACQW